MAESRMVEVGASMREARKRAGLSVAEAAERIGMSKSSVYAWERGERSRGPRADVLASMCVAYRESADRLLCLN